MSALGIKQGIANVYTHAIPTMHFRSLGMLSITSCRFMQLSGVYYPEKHWLLTQISQCIQSHFYPTFISPWLRTKISGTPITSNHFAQGPYSKCIQQALVFAKFQSLHCIGRRCIGRRSIPGGKFHDLSTTIII